jgi:hypothetical protein
MDNALLDVTISAVLGAVTGFLVVQVLVFISSIVISVLGFLRERVFERKYFFVWIKSIAGIAACGIVFFLGDYILRSKFEFETAKLDATVFTGILVLVVIGFLFHIVTRVRKIRMYMETSEFDEVIGSPTSEGHGVDDYVRKNMELLRALQGMDKQK